MDADKHNRAGTEARQHKYADIFGHPIADKVESKQ